MSVLHKLWLFKRYINQNNHDQADIRADEGFTLEMSSARYHFKVPGNLTTSL